VKALFVNESLGYFLGESEGSSKRGFFTNIERDTISNMNYRKVIYTGDNLQLVLMNLKPEDEIGEEVHEENDQFFRFEKGEGTVIINESEYRVKDGDCVIIPAGASHNIINTGSRDLQMYTIYAPPHHKDGISIQSIEDGENPEFDGQTTE
jgi:mannose-6-phosphate isomerase-like protein (cupin superfamily)